MGMISDLQDQFDNAESAAERDAIRQQLRDNGAAGIAATVGHPPEDQPQLLAEMRAQRGW